MNGDPSSQEILIIEANGKKYAAVGLITFHDIPIENRNETILNNFGLKDIYRSASLYEIVDEKKMMLAKIKYGI